MLRRIAFILLRRFRTILSTVIFGLVMLASLPANAITVNEFRLPTSSSYPNDITAGPDGNLWFTEGIGKIGRITPAGDITEFVIPTAYSSPAGITAGPDGNLWFTESANNIGRITPAGVIIEYPIPTTNSFPVGITAGPDGNLWFTENAGNIGRITTSGVITEFTIPIDYGNPGGIACGRDGNLWFVVYGSDYRGSFIGQITSEGIITEFPIITSNFDFFQSGYIVAGPDGNLWFTVDGGNEIEQLVLASIPPPGSLILWVSTGGTGRGTVTASSGTISWTGSTGTASYSSDTSVTLTAAPESGSTFDSWSGCDSTSGNTCTVSMTAAKSVTAFFVNGYTLWVSNAGTGSGIVTSSPSGIICSSTYSASFNSGTSVTLTAAAHSGSTFTGWSGACSRQSESNTCVLTMNAPQTVIANYVLTGTTSFSDVPNIESFTGYIEAIYNNGITTGCGNGDYCPSEDVTRDQMAAFLVRATQVIAGQSTVTFTCNGGANCETETPYFNDLPTTDTFFPYVQKLYELGITTGCGNNDYCPSENVTRDQMAAFIIRALYGGITGTYTCTGGVSGASVPCASTIPYFNDVPVTDNFFPYVQKVYELGITTGCGNGDYCPSEYVTRDQMAAFIARAFLGMR